MAEYQNKEQEVERVEDEVVGDVDNDGSLGGCDGEDSMYIRLISSDGHVFIIERKYAFTSTTIEHMLGVPGQFPINY